MIHMDTSKWIKCMHLLAGRSISDFPSEPQRAAEIALKGFFLLFKKLALFLKSIEGRQNFNGGYKTHSPHRQLWSFGRVIADHIPKRGAGCFASRTGSGFFQQSF
jgi:hypothetical protein